MADTASVSARLADLSLVRRWVMIATFLVLLAAGLGLLLPGIYLGLIGGSLYYAIAGLGIVISAILLLLRRRSGIYLYGLLFLATIVWSLYEVGIDGWALMPRLVFLAVGGIWLMLPPVHGATIRPSLAIRKVFGAAALVLIVGIVAEGGFTLFRGDHADTKSGMIAIAASHAAAASVTGEWTHYGNSLHGTRYSPLTEITPDNVASLKQAWVYHSGLTIPGGTRRGNLEVTPLMADGLIYGCTAFSSVFALDPVTGKQRWRYDPGIADGSGGHPVCRGVAFFRARAENGECATRILLGTVDNRLIALDAKTGRPCRDFGVDGAVDLLDGIGHFPQGWSHPTSPPTIVNGIAVIGAYVVDNQSTDVPPGVIRGYDAVTGKLVWAFDPGRPDDHGPPAPGQYYTPSTPNSWTLFSGDEKLGLVYVPMGNGSPDFVGGNRTPTTDRFSSSLVALDAATGAVRWSFQAVHHDLWDYDLAAQPVLVDFPTPGGTTPALILPTKSGQIFVLDRRSGKPLTKVVERPVPRSTLPGERSAPTQPVSVGIPDVIGADLTEADMWGLTPFDQLYCRIKFRQADYRGVFTPMRLGATIRYPGELGGIDWGGVSVDEARGVMIVNSNHMADYDELITRAQAEAEGLKPKVDPRGHNAPGAAMAGTPYAVHWGAFLTGLGVPCQRPPYGFLMAIDLKSRKVAWSRTLGSARNSGPFGVATHLPLPLGAPNIGGSIVTASGIIFIAATQDEMFRAIDERTGKVLWQTRLPAAGHATPMTYRGQDGHQYVLIAAGGQSMRDKPGDSFIAYRLK